MFVPRQRESEGAIGNRFNLDDRAFTATSEIVAREGLGSPTSEAIMEFNAEAVESSPVETAYADVPRDDASSAVSNGVPSDDVQLDGSGIAAAPLEEEAPEVVDPVAVVAPAAATPTRKKSAARGKKKPAAKKPSPKKKPAKKSAKKKPAKKKAQTKASAKSVKKASKKAVKKKAGKKPAKKAVAAAKSKKAAPKKKSAKKAVKKTAVKKSAKKSPKKKAAKKKRK